MSKIPGSKWAIGVALFSAVGFAGWQRVAKIHAPLVSALARQSESLAALDPSSASPTNLVPRISLELTNWRQLFPASEVKRSPFAFPASDEVAAEAGDPIVDPFHLLVLQGISLQPERILAVISQQVVGTGDKISGFTVEAISREEVVLRRDGEKRVLNLNFGNGPPPPRSSTHPDTLPPSPSPAVKASEAPR